MKDHDEEASREALRIEKLKIEEAKLHAREQDRSKAYMEKEQQIEKIQNAKAAQRADERAKEELKDLAREKARKEAYLAREKILADEQAARRSKNKQTDSG